jgi:citronellol/citronellal dehydrogenase
MAAEFHDAGIAFNALWPKTAIETSAIGLIAPSMLRQCRTPEIVVDAAYAILRRDSRTCTGNFFIDEEVLRAEGTTDFAKYRHAGVEESELLPDFFI